MEREREQLLKELALIEQQEKQMKIKHQPDQTITGWEPAPLDPSHWSLQPAWLEQKVKLAEREVPDTLAPPVAAGWEALAGQRSQSIRASTNLAIVRKEETDGVVATEDHELFTR